MKNQKKPRRPRLRLSNVRPRHATLQSRFIPIARNPTTIPQTILRHSIKTVASCLDVQYVVCRTVAAQTVQIGKEVSGQN